MKVDTAGNALIPVHKCRVNGMRVTAELVRAITEHVNAIRNVHVGLVRLAVVLSETRGWK
jgi:hypothetical protein